MTGRPEEITRLLQDWSRGDADALQELLPLVYAELRRMARAYLRRERTGHTLPATALVHEAYVRLVDQRNVSWQNRAHFFGVAAQLMRRILVDHSRRHAAAKRGSGKERLPLDEGLFLAAAPDGRLVVLDEALTALAALDPRQARVVELRFFGGLSVEETAQVLDLSTATVKREWSMARAWLHRQISPR